jgi:hypothetical protein
LVAVDEACLHGLHGDRRALSHVNGDFRSESIADGVGGCNTVYMQCLGGFFVFPFHFVAGILSGECGAGFCGVVLVDFHRERTFERIAACIQGRERET